MPGLVDITKSSSSSSDGFVDTEPRLETSSQAGQHDEYAAASYPGYSEKPLDDQLEPIAVIGMGTSGRCDPSCIHATLLPTILRAIVLHVFLSFTCYFIYHSTSYSIFFYLFLNYHSLILGTCH